VVFKGGSMTEDKYFAANQEDEAELERLGMLAQIFDPITIKHLEALGIKSGWRCLDVGAGGGSIADWLSERVGSDGKVIATDTNIKFLDYFKNPKFEIRQHNIVNDEIEENHYDLVHCRFLLMHLKEFQKALKKMAAAIRPGGWMLIEEMDYISHTAIERDDPEAIFINNYNTKKMEGLYKSGILDPFFGRQVRRLIEESGFEEIGNEGSSVIYRGGDMYGLWNFKTGRAGYSNLEVNDDTLRAHEIAEKRNTDPKYYSVSPTIFSAWGRKPK
jgi:ubiquinone/menaquinone biosynthesis C-methylase UbiE